ncbi:MAG: hypothetical protein HYU44_21020 [Betaproteobacteria bacterium]|nr:hypothetical protein [Betaproteobacteria bacterium]
MTALRDAGATVERLTDHFPKGTPDEKWLADLSTTSRVRESRCG